MENGNPQVHVTYRCAQGATADLDARLSKWLPDHEQSQILCFSEIPPMGLYIIADSLRWLAYPAAVFLMSKAFGGKFIEKFSEEWAKKAAEISGEIVWDSEKKTFKGLFERLKRAFQGDPTEKTNAEHILETTFLAGEESGQRVYMCLGLPADIREEGVVLHIGDISASSEGCLDLIAWFILFEDAVRKGCESILTESTEKIYSMDVVPEAFGFSIHWLVSGATHKMTRAFDIEGEAI